AYLQLDRGDVPGVKSKIIGRFVKRRVYGKPVQGRPRIAPERVRLRCPVKITRPGRIPVKMMFACLVILNRPPDKTFHIDSTLSVGLWRSGRAWPPAGSSCTCSMRLKVN